ncbi:MAG: ATP synthase subunit I [Nitrospirota bacterium]
MTTDETQLRKQAVDAILKGVAKKTALIVSVAAAGAVVFSMIQKTAQPWWFLPVSVVFGGALGLLNFRWLAISVQRVYLRQGATPAGSNVAAAIISLLKLSVIFIILFIVIKWQLLHVFGLVGGLSLCFLAILWEGSTMIHQTSNNGLK